MSAYDNSEGRGTGGPPSSSFPPPVSSSLQENVHSLPTLAEVTGRHVAAANARDDHRGTETMTNATMYTEEEEEFEGGGGGGGGGGGSNGDIVVGQMNEHRGSRGTRLPTLAFGCLFIAILLVAVGVAISMHQKGKRNLEYERDVRFRTIVNYLTNWSVSEFEDMVQVGSPQNLAANFIAHEDLQQLPIPTTAATSSKEGYEFTVRYVMAVIYYSMGGETIPGHQEGWTKKLNFLSNGHVCEWFEIIVEEYSVFPRGVGCIQSENVVDALFLDSNQLGGTIPSEMGLLTTLKVFNFDFNDIRGGIPSSLRKLSALEHASIAHNLLTGDFPNFIERLVRLETLDMSYNFMGGTLPIQLGQCQSLRALAVDNNGLHGRIDHIFGHNAASNGDLGFSILTGKEYGLVHLEALYLEDNNLSGNMDGTFLTGMFDLRDLDLSGNYFNGTLPQHFFQYTNLQILDVHDNLIGGQLPTSFPSNDALTFLALHKNQLTGEIPSSIVNLGKLTHLDLSNNQLGSTIPDEIANLSSLSYLFLAKNPFQEGTIPTSFKTLTALKDLSLKATNRIGELDEELFDHATGLGRLVLLDLDDNELSGTIPPSMGTLINLQFLLLNGNRLTGTIPPQFTNMINLRLFFVDDNQIGGDIDFFCDRSPDYFLPYIVADCDPPQVEVECNCCFRCCSRDSPCPDEDMVPSHDPMWQFGYERVFYVFGDRMAFFAVP